MTTPGVWQFGTRDLRATAYASRDAMTRPLAFERQIEIGWPSEDGILRGAMQRTSDAPAGAIRRGTPGCAVRVGPGTLHVIVALARLDCDESKILNRHVRPLLHAITKATSVPARYFDRDWIDVKSRPVGHIGFAHERASGRAIVEAFIAASTPFSVETRGSYLGKVPTTLEEACGRAIDIEKLERAVIAEFGVGVGVGVGVGDGVGDGDGDADGPWAARGEEAIGAICAGRDASGRMRVGGEWMGSFDAVRDLEDRLARGEDVRAAVDAAFGAPRTALFGVRSLVSFFDAITLAKSFG